MQADTDSSAALTLTWPEGRTPLDGYPLCPGCGHDFGKHTPTICLPCLNVGAVCSVDQDAVFDAMEEARQAAWVEAKDGH